MSLPMLITRDARRDAWVFFGLAVLVLGAGLGLRDPWPADEPRFALVARQMVESGRWLFPMRGDELYPDKPPLFMWMQAATYLVVRSWRVAFLLPSLLCALGTLWLTCDLGRRLWNRRIGLYAGYALLFALQFAYQAKKAQIDPAITFLVTLSVYALLRHLLRGPDWRWYYLGFFAAGLGVITKGVGVIALLVFLPAAFVRARRWPGLHGVGTGAALLGLVAFLGAIGLWLLPMLLAVNDSNDPALQAYADNILLRQTAQRYGNSWHHHQPPWYFLGVIATMWLPAAFALPWALPAWWRRLRRRDPRYALLLGWVACVLLFFSIPSGKRDVYVLPALPMFCLALAPLLPALLRRRAARLLLLGFVLLLAVLGLGGAIAALAGEPGFETRLEAERGLDPGSDALWWMLLAIGAGAALATLWGRLRHVLAATVLTLSLLWTLFGFVGYPLLNDASSARALMRAAGERIGPAGELGLVAWKEQNLLQADRAAHTFGFRRPAAEQLRDALRWQADAPATRWIFILDSALGDCVLRERAIDLGRANRRQWWLFRADAVAAHCR
ncbi:ArnT family glycosyltransferase [Chiayiivirga sp.]|jgi:4-amino-4-deoxy-L-arabinose transferase-like glycosyltransferase|uniref:ArnT family glycosyltransferase n=1 Tax=Chiayiivirga sp. TaxID=2041042 RepID=UPI003DA9078D